MAKETTKNEDILPGSGFKARYINPLTDFGFKRIFGTEANKDLLINFLEAVLAIDGGIKDLRYDNPEQQGRLQIDRRAIFDLYCVTGNGEHIIVEMQNVRQDYFKDRVLYYATFPIQEQGEKSQGWNFKLAPVNIINFKFTDSLHPDEEGKYASYVQLLDKETHRVFYDKLAFVFLELPRFTKTVDELKTDFDRWMYVLKHLTELQDLPEPLRNRVFQKLFRVAEVAKMSLIEKKSYNQSLKEYRDMYLMEYALKEKETTLKKITTELKKSETELKRSKTELKKSEIELKKSETELKKSTTELKKQEELIRKQKSVILNTARILLEAGIPVERVAESTGLSMNEIEKMQKTIGR